VAPTELELRSSIPTDGRAPQPCHALLLIRRDGRALQTHLETQTQTHKTHSLSLSLSFSHIHTHTHTHTHTHLASLAMKAA
jgi:hypothetical protein